MWLLYRPLGKGIGRVHLYRTFPRIEGKRQVRKVNGAWASRVAWVTYLALLYWGGFFNRIQMKAKGFKWWLILGIEVQPDATQENFSITRIFYEQLRKEVPGPMVERAWVAAKEYFLKNA